MKKKRTHLDFRREDWQHSRLSGRTSVAADGAGMTAFHGLTTPQPAPLLNFSVSRFNEGAMKRGDVLAAIADLTGDDPVRRESAIGVLEAMPRGFLEDHPLPRKKVAPYIPRLAQLLGSDVPVVIKKWCAQL